MVNTNPRTIHPVLRELGLPLPLASEESWTRVKLSAPGATYEQLRLTRGVNGDLIIEVCAKAGSDTRYVFDEAGLLVSLHRNGSEDDSLFQSMRASVLRSISKCYSK